MIGPLRLALALCPLSCAGDAQDAGEAEVDRPSAAATVTPAADDAWWRAVRGLELDAARALDGGGDRGAFLDALALGLEGGSAAAEAPLCALATSASDPTLRRRAGQAALNLLRIEARWEALASFGERCGLDLKDGAIPAALPRLPVETLVPPDAPVVLRLRETERGLPLVTARVVGPEGTLELLALVDTGAGACVLRTDVARRLGVAPRGEDTIPILGSAGRGAVGRPGAVHELGLGALRVTDVPVLIVETHAVETLLPGVSFVIGWEILQPLAVEISGAAGELVLRRSEPRPPGAEPNLVLLHEPVVRLRSGDHELLFLLDTGANTTDATPRLVARLGPTELPEVEDVLRGLGAERQARVPAIPELPIALGGTMLRLGNVPVWDMPPEPQRLLELDGTLGADVALAGRLIIDGPSRLVTVRPR